MDETHDNERAANQVTIWFSGRVWRRKDERRTDQQVEVHGDKAEWWTWMNGEADLQVKD